MKNRITGTQQSLTELKNDVIGLVKINDQINLVLSVSENNTADTVTITNLGAIQFNYCFPLRYGELKLFPEGKNMNEMLDSPFEFDSFLKSFS